MAPIRCAAVVEGNVPLMKQRSIETKLACDVLIIIGTAPVTL
jgi:hypothetical protein